MSLNLPLAAYCKKGFPFYLHEKICKLFCFLYSSFFNAEKSKARVLSTRRFLQTSLLRRKENAAAPRTASAHVAAQFAAHWAVEQKLRRSTCDVSRTPQRIFSSSCAFNSCAAAKRRFIAIQRGRRIAYPRSLPCLGEHRSPLLGSPF